MFRDDGYCFACGRENPVGLRLSFELQADGRMRTEFVPQRIHQGFAGIVHGGILATLADECMARLVLAKGVPAVTGRLEMSYKHPAEVGKALTVVAELVREERRLLELVCRLSNPEGRLVAEGKAIFVKVLGK